MQRLIFAALSTIALVNLASAPSMALSNRFENSRESRINKLNERFENSHQTVMNKLNERFEKEKAENINK